MIGSRYDRQIRGALAVASWRPAGAGPVAPPSLNERTRPHLLVQARAGFTLSGWRDSNPRPLRPEPRHLGF